MSGILKLFDRILQINQTRQLTWIVACLAVPFISAAVDKIDLLFGNFECHFCQSEIIPLTLGNKRFPEDEYMYE